jgi:hypothetical protein
MLNLVLAVVVAILVGALAEVWKGQSGTVWGIITLMLYFVVWSICSLAVTWEGGAQLSPGATFVAAVSGLTSAGLMVVALWSLHTRKAR